MSDAYDPDGRRIYRPYPNVYQLPYNKEVLIRNWTSRIPTTSRELKWETLKRYDVDSRMAQAIAEEWTE